MKLCQMHKKAAWINYSTFANIESKISDFNCFFKVQREGKKGFKYNTAVILYLHGYSVIEQDLTKTRRCSKCNYRHYFNEDIFSSTGYFWS